MHGVDGPSAASLRVLLEIDIVTIIKLLTVNGRRAVAIMAPVNPIPHLTFFSDSSDKGVGGVALDGR